MTNEVFDQERTDAAKVAKGDPPNDAAAELALKETRKAPVEGAPTRGTRGRA